jgi:hypothetical protein
VTNRGLPQRRYIFVAWLAIIAVLIDGLLPTAVPAAATSGVPTTPLTLCNAASGDHPPIKHAPNLSPHHCALCAAFVVGLLPTRSSGFLALFFAGAAHLTIVASIMRYQTRQDYAATLPRAPPLVA